MAPPPPDNVIPEPAWNRVKFYLETKQPSSDEEEVEKEGDKKEEDEMTPAQIEKNIDSDFSVPSVDED